MGVCKTIACRYQGNKNNPNPSKNYKLPTSITHETYKTRNYNYPYHKHYTCYSSNKRKRHVLIRLIGPVCRYLADSLYDEQQ